jgi:hypothetical protein
MNGDVITSASLPVAAPERLERDPMKQLLTHLSIAGAPAIGALPSRPCPGQGRIAQRHAIREDGKGGR